MKFSDLFENNTDPFVRIAKACETVEEFIQKTDGMDVLYRGHYGGPVGDNSFMTDYVGHAAEYVDDSGRIEAFAYDHNDVFYYNDMRFNEMRAAYRDIKPKQLADIYRAAIDEERLGNAMMNSGLKTGAQVLAKVQKILRSDVPYSKFCGNFAINDLLIPLMQKFALDIKGKNIIAFHGGDYIEYGGQTEYVVGKISHLTDLRKFYNSLHK